MAKIGILTFHYVDNSGAQLQLLGTMSFLSKNGFYVQIIDYRSSVLCQRNALIQNPAFRFKKGWKAGHSIINKLKKGFGQVLYAFKRNLKIINLLKGHESFNKFRSKYSGLLTKRIRNIEGLIDISRSFDAIVIGSDQVWNTELFNYSIDDVYFANSPDIKCPVIGYAVSAGSILNLEEKTIFKLCKNFKSISAREIQLAEQISKALGVEIKTVLDPVFLCSKEYWVSLCNDVGFDEYVFLYVLEPNPLLIKTLNMIEKMKGKSLKVIEVGFKKFYSKSTLISNFDPIFFLSLVRNAEYIITNSFHATAFSVIFEKEFYCIKHTTRNNRMETLLTKAQLLHRLIKNESDVKTGLIDYSIVNCSLQNEIAQSRRFLLTSLGVRE